MCGIIGYIGDRKASEVLISGLSHLEYRGYDSSGIALMRGSDVQIFKAQGKLVNLIEMSSKFRKFFIVIDLKFMVFHSI